MRKEQDKMDTKVKKDYSKINSRINTNLNGAPPQRRMRGIDIEGEYIEVGDETINNLIQRDESSVQKGPE
jgi:hypothetical protein